MVYMAKTNYTKVEEALTEGYRKMEVNKLLVAADENAAGKGKKKTDETKKIDPLLLRRLTKIDQDLQFLEKNGKDPYGQLNIDKEEIQKFVKFPSTLIPQDWEKVKLIKEKIEEYKAALERKEAISDDELIKEQRKEQKTKRFNVNKKWIPLQ